MYPVDNDEWIVDDLGMRVEMHDGTFIIDAASLADMISVRDAEYLYWPVHIASETRFDIERFIEAYRMALDRHAGRYSPDIDPTLLERSVEVARKIWGGRAICG